MNIIGWLVGEMEVELTSAHLEISLDMISKDIEIHKVRRINDLVCIFVIRRIEYVCLSRLCAKLGDDLQIRKKKGIYWTMAGAAGRPVLLVGICMLLLMIFVLPTRVLFIRVDGNINTPDREILAAAEDSGIYFWAKRREIRSEQVKNALLSQIGSLQWVGINTAGCTAVISVRERNEPESVDRKGEVASLVALRDGYILSCTPVRGTALVQPGRSVKEGQVLISGYTDCGLSIQATKAEGEVQALTSRPFQGISPDSFIRFGEKVHIKRKISLVIRKKRINLWKDSGIWGSSCGRMYEEYYITLPGDFCLPVALCVETYTQFQKQREAVSEQEAWEQLSLFAERSLQQQMVGGRILHSNYSVIHEPGCYRISGSYACTEMIGKLRQEQIGDTNGKVS